MKGLRKYKFKRFNGKKAGGIFLRIITMLISIFVPRGIPASPPPPQPAVTQVIEQVSEEKRQYIFKPGAYLSGEVIGEDKRFQILGDLDSARRPDHLSYFEEMPVMTWTDPDTPGVKLRSFRTLPEGDYVITYEDGETTLIIESKVQDVKEEANIYRVAEVLLGSAAGLVVIGWGIRAKLKVNSRRAALKEWESKMRNWDQCISKSRVKEYLKYKESGVIPSPRLPTPTPLISCLKAMHTDIEQWIEENPKVFPKNVENEIDKFLSYIDPKKTAKIQSDTLKRSLESLKKSISESANFLAALKGESENYKILLLLISTIDKFLQ